jgi:hypothetical protein
MGGGEAVANFLAVAPLYVRYRSQLLRSDLDTIS